MQTVLLTIHNSTFFYKYGGHVTVISYCREWPIVDFFNLPIKINRPSKQSTIGRLPNQIPKLYEQAFMWDLRNSFKIQRYKKFKKNVFVTPSSMNSSNIYHGFYFTILMCSVHMMIHFLWKKSQESRSFMKIYKIKVAD